MNGIVHSFESFGTVDRPGTRFVIFLKGCLLDASTAIILISGKRREKYSVDNIIKKI